MAPCPDLKGFPRPKMSLELAFAMLRLAPWLVLWGFKTLSGFMGFQNWRMAPCPDLQCFPKPKMSLELALAMLRLAPSLALWDFKTDGWPPSRSQRLPQAQNVVGAGFSHAAAGALAGFMGFQNWRMAPGPDLKGFPTPKMLWDFKTDGWPPVPISKASPDPKCRWSWL